MQTPHNSISVMRVVGWVGLTITSVVAALYFAALVVASEPGTQLTRMLDMSNSMWIVTYNAVYTTALVLCVVSLAAFSPSRWYFMVPFCIAAGTALVLTVVPVVRSCFADFRPSFYEYYLGETITAIGLLLMVASLSAAYVQACRT